MIELIAGGARSGKSSYALKVASSLSGEHIFVATATAGDRSMQSRIERHQQERGDSWALVEEPLGLSAVVAQSAANQVLLIDCLTLWLTNWLCGDQPAQWPDEKKQFLEQMQSTRADVIVVTNEVGMGVVPMGELSREFVDQAGWLHQELAAIADKVTMVTFGIPQTIKDH